jgi:hypothetical protein
VRVAVVRCPEHSQDDPGKWAQILLIGLQGTYKHILRSAHVTPLEHMGGDKRLQRRGRRNSNRTVVSLQEQEQPGNRLDLSSFGKGPNCVDLFAHFPGQQLAHGARVVGADQQGIQAVHELIELSLQDCLVIYGGRDSLSGKQASAQYEAEACQQERIKQPHAYFLYLWGR